MPKIDRVLEVALYVEDLDRSIEFYTRVLGCETVDADERLCALTPGAGQLLLLCRKKASLDRNPGAHDADGRQHVAFAVPAADLEAWQSRLERAGVTVEERRHWHRGGVSLYFRDPDGHLLELATPGVWSVY